MSKLPTPVSAYGLKDLLYLMERLRDPENGCPWDIKQRFESIVPSTIEEAYEVADAIEQGDRSQLKEELGDLLFQVIFYSQLGKEEGVFDFHDIVDVLTQKLIRRHPHVFVPEDLYAPLPSDQSDMHDDTEVKAQWEAIKQKERKQKGHSGLLDDVPVGLPAATRALKLQKRAAQVGFDWPNTQAVMSKIKEELGELEEAIQKKTTQEQLSELGDVLFSVVNLARHIKVEPETALRHTNQKFVRRFEYIEQQMAERGSALSAEYIDDMELLWEEAKRQE